MARVGDPTSGVILAPGAVIDLPEVWADRYIASGSAVEVEAKKPEPKPKAEKPAAKPKGKSKK
ncbi:MAG: hypothetical protein ABI539_15715 [Acidobacteriota bacterium]